MRFVLGHIAVYSVNIGVQARNDVTCDALAILGHNDFSYLDGGSKLSAGSVVSAPVGASDCCEPGLEQFDRVRYKVRRLKFLDCCEACRTLLNVRYRLLCGAKARVGRH